MLPASWPNGEYQQAQQHFQPSQSSLQLAQASVGSYKVTRGLNSPESSFIYKSGIWQQASTKRPAGNSHFVNDATAQQHNGQNSMANVSTQNLSDTRTNITYCQQNMSSNEMVLLYLGQVQQEQNGNPSSNNDQHNTVQRSLHRNVNAVSTEAFLAPQQVIRTIDQNLNYSQNVQQSNISHNPQIRPDVHQSSVNRLAHPNSLPNTHNYFTSNSNYINNGGVVTSSINTNLKSPSVQQAGSFPNPQPHYNLQQLSKIGPATTNSLPSKQNCQNSNRRYSSGTGVVSSSSGTNSNGKKHQRSHLLRLLRNSGQNISLKAPCQTLNKSSHGNSQFVSPEIMLESSQTVQPMVYSAAENCNSKSSMLPLVTEQSLAKNTSGMPTVQHSTDKLPQQSLSSGIIPTGGSGDTLNRDGVEFNHKITAEKEREMLAELDMLVRLYSNDNSVQLSGQGVTKAVAVVPPLTQNNINIANECTSSIKQCSQYIEEHKSLPEGFKEGSPLLRDECKTSPETSNPPNRPSSTPLASSKLPQSQNTNQKMDRISDEEPGLSVTAEQASPSEVLTSQNSAMDNNETPADPKLCANDLSSIKTVQWTVQQLQDYIKVLQRDEKSNPTATSCCDKVKIFRMFWGGSVKELAHFYRSTYKDIVAELIRVLGKIMNSDVVVMSEVMDDFKEKVIENHRVLKHDEIYEDEFPYVSSWLNINEKLDDIDKEFGFPWSLKTHQLSDTQQDCTSIDTNGEISNQSLDKSPHMECEPADSNQEESNADENSSKQCSSNLESNTEDSDPFYSFKIQILPPEEAKMIFEENKIRLKEDSLPQKTTELCTNGVSSSIVKDSETTERPKTTDISTVQQICCLTKWIETLVVGGSDFMSKCRCNAQKDGIKGKSTSAKQAQVDENSDESVTSSMTEIDNTFLNEDFIGVDDTPEACELKKILHDNMDSSNSSMNQVQEQVPSQMDSPMENSELAPIESPGSSYSCTSEEIEKKGEISTNNGSFSETDTDYIQLQLSESSDEPDLPMEEEPSRHERASVLSHAKPSKRKKEMRTAELLLFGSTSQGTPKENVFGPTPSSALLPVGALRPPKMLSVVIGPLKPTTSESIRPGNYSVKGRIYEKWRKSFPPLTISHNKVNVLKKLPVHRGTVMKAKKLGLLDQKKKGFRNIRKRRKKVLAEPTVCGSHGIMDPQKDSALGFKVLPETFSFKDGSHKKSSIVDSVMGKTPHTEGANERPRKAVKWTRDNKQNENSGTWGPKPERLYSPLRSTTACTTSSVFQKFQERYQKKTQTPSDA